MPHSRKRGFLDVNEQEQLAKKLFGESNVAAFGDIIENVVEQSHLVPVWHDDDDVISEVQLPSGQSSLPLKKNTDHGDGLCQLFQSRQRPTPKWAELDLGERGLKQRATDSEDELERTIEELTQSAQHYVDKNSCLCSGFIPTFRWPDIAIGHHDTKPVNVVQFHKVRPVVLTAGNAGKVQLFKVGDVMNCGNFLQSVQFTNYPVTSMGFLKGGDSVICGSSRQNCFMQYELDYATVMQIKLPRSVPSQNVGRFVVSCDGTLLAVVGHSSQVHILSSQTMELIKTFSAPNNVTSLQFLPGSNEELWGLTEYGEIVIWNTRGSFQHVHRHEEALRGTIIRLSKDGTKVACGSNSGIITIFDVTSICNPDPKSLTTISNLVTSCDSISFSHDSEIMAFSSKVKRNHIRLLHVPSQNVFKNFPRKHEKMTNVGCAEFSPHSAYLGIGCLDGHFILDRINHYEDY